MKVIQHDISTGETTEREMTPEEVTEYETAQSAVYIPHSISPRQIRQALTRIGLRTQVEQAVTNGDQDLKDWWEFSTAFERGHPQVIVMGTALGIDSSSIDSLWQLGASL